MKKKLNVIDVNGTFATDSREVAGMTGKRHDNLIRDIGGYVKILTTSNLRALDFFIESDYVDSKGETRTCYLVTRKGCEMVANKMTGEKGVLFTAEYVTKFEEMESTLKSKALKCPTSYAEALRELATSVEEREKLEKQNLLMTPKADYYDLYIDTKSLTSFRNTAKLLKIGEKKFIDWLIYKKFIYRDKRNALRPYSSYVQTLFMCKEFGVANGFTGISTLITEKGISHFEALLKKEGLI